MGRVGERRRPPRRQYLLPVGVALTPERSSPGLVEGVEALVPQAEPDAERARAGVAVAGDVVAGVLVRDVPHRQRWMVVVPRRELGREGDGVLAVGRGGGTPGLPAAGPEGVAVLVDRQRLRVCVGEPGRWGGRSGGRVQPGPREDPQGDEGDPGARHQVDVLGPGLARPLFRVVVATERQPVLGPPSHARHPLGKPMGKSTETNTRLVRGADGLGDSWIARNRYKTTNPAWRQFKTGPSSLLTACTRGFILSCGTEGFWSFLSLFGHDADTRPLVHRRRSRVMARPSTEAEYLARMVPSSAAGVSRRYVLRGALGAGALLAAPPLLASCSSSSPSGSSGGGTAPATGTVSLGSNQSDATPKAAVQSVMDAFQKANSGLTVKINTIDHNSFQENINNYLQGAPDDTFTWFSGYRMRFFAAKDLAGDISDVWGNISGMSDALKKASTGDDGKQYFVPSTYYPWAIFYRKSVW